MPVVYAFMKRWLLIFLFLLSLKAVCTVIVIGHKSKYLSINKAIKDAKSFDTLIIKEDIYYENNLIIDKPLVILGENFPVINGKKNGSIFIIKANNTVIKGLVLQEVKTSYIEEWAAIKLIEVHNCIIENNKLKNNFFGIYIQHSRYCKVRNNEIKGNAINELSSGNGIHLWYSKNIIIENNAIFNHRDGIYIEYTDSSIIVNNKSIKNIRYGLHFMFSNFNTYQNNEFKSNGAGVAVMFSKYIKMINNKFEYNWGHAAYGLLLKEIYDSEVSGNLFKQNTTAIYGESVIRVFFKKNNFESNGKAILFLGSCYDNLVTLNNFILNTFDLSADTDLEGNIFEKNYWSNYTGYDINKDEIGDVPYRPVTLFNYIVNKNPVSIILLRSLFIDILNYSEKVMPLFLPENLKDNQPLMKKSND